MQLSKEESIAIFPRPSNATGTNAVTPNTGRRTLPGRVKLALAVMLGILAGLVVSELALRLLWHNPYRLEFSDHVIKVRIHHPNTDHIFSRALVDPETPRGRLRTDARSYILPSFQHKEPDATIAFLGGSTTECSAVQEDLRFPALVSKLLDQHGLKVNTLNAAYAGNTLHDSLNVLLNHVVYDRPDIVVVMHASNDIGVLAAHGDYRSRTGQSVSPTDLAKWSLQLASSKLYLAGLLRHSATSSVIRPSDPGSDWRNDPSLGNSLSERMFRQRLKSFIHVALDFGIQPVLMTQPFSGSTNSLTPRWVDRVAQDRFNTLIRQVGQEEGVAVIDLVRHLQGRVPQWNKPMEIFYDAIHVTDKGSIVYAQYIVDRVLPLVNQLAKRTDQTGVPSHASEKLRAESGT
jgi:hypothetical protein